MFKEYLGEKTVADAAGRDHLLEVVFIAPPVSKYAVYADGEFFADAESWIDIAEEFKAAVVCFSR